MAKDHFLSDFHGKGFLFPNQYCTKEKQQSQTISCGLATRRNSAFVSEKNDHILTPHAIY